MSEKNKAKRLYKDLRTSTPLRRVRIHLDNLTPVVKSLESVLKATVELRTLKSLLHVEDPRQNAFIGVLDGKKITLDELSNNIRNSHRRYLELYRKVERVTAILQNKDKHKSLALAELQQVLGDQVNTVKKAIADVEQSVAETMMNFHDTVPPMAALFTEMYNTYSSDNESADWGGTVTESGDPLTLFTIFKASNDKLLDEILNPNYVDPVTSFVDRVFIDSLFSNSLRRRLEISRIMVENGNPKSANGILSELEELRTRFRQYHRALSETRTALYDSGDQSVAKLHSNLLHAVRLAPPPRDPKDAILTPFVQFLLNLQLCYQATCDDDLADSGVVTTKAMAAMADRFMVLTNRLYELKDRDLSGQNYTVEVVKDTDDTFVAPEDSFYISVHDAAGNVVKYHYVVWFLDDLPSESVEESNDVA